LQKGDSLSVPDRATRSAVISVVAPVYGEEETLPEFVRRTCAAVRPLDSFEAYHPRAIKEANVAAARTQAGFAFAEADLVDLPAVRAGSGSLHGEEGSEPSR
jgi:hypothetical protein